MTATLKTTLRMAVAALSLSCYLALGAQAQQTACQADYHVVPLPQSIVMDDGGQPFALSSRTAIRVVCTDDSQRPAMNRNAAFLQAYIEERTRLQIAIDTDAATVATAATAVDTEATVAPNVIILTLDADIPQDEGYRIAVEEHSVTVAGRTAAGVFHAIQTLRKSLPALAETVEGQETGVGQVWLPAVVITDAPRFRWRGMMLDCVRHFFPLDFVKRYIDILALHNMNVFHWHLTDDQGWRIEIKSCPELTQIGAWRDGTVVGNNSDVDDATPHGGYYTQDEAREIIAYAAERHITVVPEFEMPGHTKAFLASYPDLGCTGGPYRVGHHWGVYNDVLCIGNPDLYPRLQQVLDELMDLFPAPYIHVGGDETPTTRWDHCPKCQAVALDEGETLQGHFTQWVEAYVNAKGKKMIGWDEVLATGAPATATIMAWRGIQAGVEAAEAGHDVIMAPLTHCYFDYIQTSNRYYEPSSTGSPTDVAQVYSLEPVPDSLSIEAKSHILGVQANLWCEYVTLPATAEYMVLPRAAALSEVQWTDPSERDYDQFRTRLDRLVRIYDEQGWQYALHLWPERTPQKRWMIDN